MTRNIQEIFKNLNNIKPSQELEKKILQKIAKEQRWQKRKMLIFADSLVLSSLGGFAFALLSFWRNIYSSEFWSLSKLAFSDASVVFSFWNNFLFSLLESFPAPYFAILLTPVFFLLMGMKIYFGNDYSYKH